MKIDVRTMQSNNGTKIIEVSFEGAFDLAAYQQASVDFLKEVASVSGKPFRVVVDFLNAKIMDDKEADIFVQAQNQACSAGMERDAFVTKSAVVRAQFERLAEHGLRIQKLGPMNFFDNLEDARAFLRK